MVQNRVVQIARERSVRYRLTGRNNVDGAILHARSRRFDRNIVQHASTERLVGPGDDSRHARGCDAVVQLVGSVDCDDIRHVRDRDRRLKDCTRKNTIRKAADADTHGRRQLIVGDDWQVIAGGRERVENVVWQSRIRTVVDKVIKAVRAIVAKRMVGTVDVAQALVVEKFARGELEIKSVIQSAADERRVIEAWVVWALRMNCLLYTSPSPRDRG